MSVDVLVVDDVATHLKLARVVLAAAGYRVALASDADEALAAISADPPRLVLMDIRLPGVDGLELTRRLKADPTTRAIVVIAVTAYAMKGDEERMLAAGCDGYLAKPLESDVLVGAVARYLGAGRTSSP